MTTRTRTPRHDQPAPTRMFAGAGCITVSFRPAIPRRVAPQQSPLPLRRHGHPISPFTPGIANRPANLRLSFGTFDSPSTPGIANMPANLYPFFVSHHRGAVQQPDPDKKEEDRSAY